MSEIKRNRNVWLVLVLILGATGVLRLWTIDTPLIDRTVWKEADYVQIASNYASSGFNPLEPRISWPAGPSQITALELPLVPYATSILYGLFGTSELTTRIVPLVSWLLVGLYTFLLVRREFDAATALAASAVTMVMAYAHYFGTFLFSEPTAIAFSVGAVYHAAHWRDEGDWLNLAASCLMFSLAVALKLTPLYMALPLLHLFVQRCGFGLRAFTRFSAFSLCALIIPVAWYAYAYRLAVDHNDVFGIFGGLLGSAHDKFQTIDMLTSPHWYETMYWRMSLLVSGTVGAALLLVGLYSVVSKRVGTVFMSYLAAIVAFFCIVAEGQLDAPYRQLTMIVPAAVFIAVGMSALTQLVVRLCENVKVGSGRYVESLFRPLIPIVFLTWSAIYSPEVLDRINGDPMSPTKPVAWELSRLVKGFSNEGDLIVTAGEYSIHKGGNDLSPLIYYYSDRRGWSLQQDDYKRTSLEDFVDKGASLLVARNINREETLRSFVERMSTLYPVLARNEDLGYAILDLGIAR